MAALPAPSVDNTFETDSTITVACTLPDNLLKPMARLATALVNNAICFLSEELRHELNGVKIDRCRDVGLTSLMKGYASCRPGHKHRLQNAGWSGIDNSGE